MEKDFSNYKIYIPEDWRSGSLLNPKEKHSIFPEKNIYTFIEGIKKLQEEKRGMYLPNEESTNENIEYFQKNYGIFTC